VLLTRQDWRGPNANWGPNGLGYWEVNVTTPGHYDVKLRFEPLKAEAEAALKCGSASARMPLATGATECVFPSVSLGAGEARFAPQIVQGAATLGVQYVEIKKLD
jgi:hypothetical protein